MKKTKSKAKSKTKSKPIVLEEDIIFNYVNEEGISITKFFNSTKDKLIVKVNFPEAKNYFYSKEFTYQDITKSYPIFGIEENLININILISESINNYGINVLFNENDENKIYLIIKIKINSKIKEVKLELDKTDYSNDELFKSLIEKTNILLDERKKICDIKSIVEVFKETNAKDNFTKKLEEIESKLIKMESTLTYLKESTLLSSSNILSSSEEVKILLDLIKEIELENIEDENNAKYQNNQNITFRLVYRASRDGDLSKDFHKRCDKIGPNITLVKTDKNIKFGGFTNNNWEIPKNENEKKEDDDEDSDDNNKNQINTDDGEQKSDPGAFCFSISNKKVYPFNCKKDNAIFCSKRYGPTFCENIFSINTNMLTKGGYCSKKKNSCFVGQNKDYEISGGEKKFKVKELEVFEIVTI